MLKGTIDPDHLPKNLFRFSVPGSGIELTIISLGELSSDLENVTLPDRVQVSGGNTKAGTTEIVTPSHHKAEQAFWEDWFKKSQHPLAPDYKKSCTLTEISGTGLSLQSWVLVGVFPTRRGLSEHSMEDEGADVRRTWTVSYDDFYPVE